MKLGEIVNWLNSYLGIADFPQDQSINGLQVEACNEVKRIGVAVDACLEVFEKAERERIDLLIVHHGLYWRAISPCITKAMISRVKHLLNKKISLYAAHLPLDAHEEVGNNVQIIRTLGFEPLGKIDEIAWFCKLQINFQELIDIVSEKIAEPKMILNFGPEKIEKLVVASGGGTHHIFELEGGETLLTGEFNHYGFHYAKELGINVIVCGHYATEVFGVKALGRKIKEEFGIKCFFIDVPTNL